MNSDPRQREDSVPPGEPGTSAFYDAYWLTDAEWNRVHPGNRHRTRLIIGELRRIFAAASDQGPRRLIDIGCGDGSLLRAIGATYPRAELYGEDISPRAARSADDICAQTFAHDLERGPLESDHVFDVAVLTEVLEHVAEPRRLLTNLRANLSPSSRVIITVPIGPITAFDRQIGHFRHYSLRELHDLCAEAGYQTIRAYRWGFPFFSLYRSAVWLAGHRARAMKPTEHGHLGRAVIAALNASFHLCIRSGRVGRQVIAVMAPKGPHVEGGRMDE